MMRQGKLQLMTLEEVILHAFYEWLPSCPPGATISTPICDKHNL